MSPVQPRTMEYPALRRRQDYLLAHPFAPSDTSVNASILRKLELSAIARAVDGKPLGWKMRKFAQRRIAMLRQRLAADCKHELSAHRFDAAELREWQSALAVQA